MSTQSHPLGLGKHLVALAGTVIGGLSGVWLMTAPFALSYQPDGAEWVDATRVGFFTGLAVLAVSLAGSAVLVAGAVGALRTAGVLAPRRPRAERRVRAEEAPTEVRDRHDTDVDLQQVLVPLAASLLKELQQPERRSYRQLGQAEQPSPQEESTQPEQQEPKHAE
jgi:hypothetical protein